MELRAYLVMLRRGWLTILALMVIGVVAAAAYVSQRSETYSTSALILVAPQNAGSLSELQSGTQFAELAAPTYAAVIDSPQVLIPTAERLGLPGPEYLPGAVQATPLQSTGLIAVTVTAGSARDAAAVANAAAASAIKVLPTVSDVQAGSAGGGSDGSNTGSGSGSSGDNGNSSPLITVTSIQSAPEPGAAQETSASRILVIGLLIGLVLGVAATITRQSVDTRIRRAEDLDETSDLPLLAVLPSVRRRQRAVIAVRDETTGTAVESFRTLRTNVSYLDDGDRHSLLVVAAAEDGLGARVPVNLAWSIAATGRRVLLIDLDLRGAPVSKLLPGLEGPGVGELLADGRALDQTVQTTSQPNLLVLAAGANRDDAADLLSSAAMLRMIDAAESAYDVVVVHAPALLSYSDGAVVSRSVRHTVVTVAAGRTREAQVHAALETLDNVRVQPLGLVLTGARLPKRGSGSAQVGPPTRKTGSRSASAHADKQAAGVAPSDAEESVPVKAHRRAT